MEEYMETEIWEEDADMEDLTETVSGNDAGMDAVEDPVSEDGGDDAGQDELLESINALVEALTPAEEDAENETGTEETETMPSETETAILELLERIYEEMGEGRTADTLYYEAWTECQTASQEKEEIQETWEIYKIALFFGILFLCAIIAGIQTARTVWERFL